MLDAGNHQGKFGADYVRVLASAAGLLWSQDDVDMDGIDLCLKLPGRTPRGFSPRIDVQVKTVSSVVTSRGVLPFDGLTRAQFDRLAGADAVVPRYLFVVHVPRRADQYADLGTAGLLLRHLGYYLPMSEYAPLRGDDPRARVRVRIPVSNVLTAARLRALVTDSGIVAAERP